MHALVISRTRTPTSPFGGSPPHTKISSRGGAFQLAQARMSLLVTTRSLVIFRGKRLEALFGSLTKISMNLSYFFRELRTPPLEAKMSSN